MKTQEELKKRIPGWGADLDWRNRPAGRMEANEESILDANNLADQNKIHRQIAKVKIFVSSEHKGLTPVFGTTCPPRGLSGRIRELAFSFSEGQKAHWLLLLAADRVNVFEGAVRSLLEGRPENPFVQMGLKAELRRGAFRTRLGQHRYDVKRQGLQLLLLAGVGAGIGALLSARNWRDRPDDTHRSHGSNRLNRRRTDRRRGDRRRSDHAA